MNEYIHKIKGFLPRKASIFHDKTYIYGAPNSGKTLLSLQYAQNFKHVYYVNLDMFFCSDSYIHEQETIRNLPKHTQLLIIDNFLNSFMENIEVNIPRIYIGSISECPRDFKKLRILGLSFDEYLGFDRKNLNIETLLSNFIKDGNNPEIFFLPDYKKKQYKWQVMKLALKNDFLLFSHILSLQSLKTSTNAIFNYLKQKVKVSKDRIYPLIDNFCQEGILHICKHIDEIDSNNKKYKLYLYDFSLSEFACSKHFVRLYENMVFLELLSMGFCLAYSEYCDFIDLDKMVIFICVPFSSIESIEKRIIQIRKKEKRFSNFKIFAISMSCNHSFNDNEMIIDFTSLTPMF